jgi:hypothetical protein
VYEKLPDASPRKNVTKLNPERPKKFEAVSILRCPVCRIPRKGNEAAPRQTKESEDMKFMLMILDNVKAQANLQPGDLDRIVKEHSQFAASLAAQKKLVDGQRLRPDNESTRITIEKGKRVVSDGPYPETKEILGGYYLIDCASKQEAIEWAKKCPIFESDAVELRPIWEG